jgi:hypothetical protein
MRSVTGFFPQNEIDNKYKELLTTLFALSGSAVTIPYAEFLRILGILDNKEAKEAYEIFKVLLEKIDRLKKER